MPGWNRSSGDRSPKLQCKAPGATATVRGSCEGVGFVSLQSGGTEDLRTLLEQNGIRVRELAPQWEDMDELAAAIASLDLMVSIDNTTAHLAGALGRTVWVLLNRTPEWRYLRQGNSVPWYPSAHLFRQPRFGDWAAVMREVRAALEGWKKERASR